MDTCSGHNVYDTGSQNLKLDYRIVKFEIPGRIYTIRARYWEL